MDGGNDRRRTKGSRRKNQNQKIEEKAQIDKMIEKQPIRVNKV